jgi:hypothetical protein
LVVCVYCDIGYCCYCLISMGYRQLNNRSLPKDKKNKKSKSHKK